jgi:predicted nucleic acid-binding protein
MEIILDADVIIAGEKGVLDLKRWVDARPEDHFQVAAITIAEVWHGLVRASDAHRDRRQRHLEAVLSGLSILAYTEQIAYRHANIWAELDSSGNMIGYYDLIVAATAFEHGCAVATFNKRHFSRVEGLTIVEPTLDKR